MAENQTIATFIAQSKEFYDRYHEFYEPLDPSRKEIRLMQILPALFSENIINLTLNRVDLADEPYYETISYTWGPMSPTKQVFIHGLAYNVTVNQYDALRRLRSDRPRIIWMDVVCIDQANLAERAHQVSIMGEIYANAARTDIWLGELDETSYTPISDEQWDALVIQIWEWNTDQKLFIDDWTSSNIDKPVKEFPNDLVDGAKFILEQFADDEHPRGLQYCTIVDDNVKLNRSWYDAIGFLSAIMQQPWWDRVWVLQEVLLSKENPIVLFGGHQVLLEIFLKASDFFVKHFFVEKCCLFSVKDIFFEDQFEIVAKAFYSLLLLSMIKQDETPGRMSIERAAALTNMKQATDTRDFIYGLLGLIRAEDRVPVDYTLSTEQVFLQTSWHYFRVYNDFDWLEKGGFRSPSWCIDWVDTDRLGFRFNYTFTRDETETPDWDRTRLCGSRLELPANCIGKVKLVFAGERNPDVSEARADLEMIWYWLDCLKDAGFQSDLLREPTLDDFDAEFFLELFSIFFRNTKVDLKTPSWRRLNDDDLYDISFWWSGMVQMGKNGSTDSPDYEPFLNTATNFRNYTQNSTLALTEENQICLVPIGTKDSDYLYHIRACRPVMVLRSVAENIFCVIGPGYLSGAMGSDGWREDEEKVIALL